ncbi:hypothetical protein GWI33_013908 [Rhynchophorus ferrugineus]|uniref:Uncharacterized protein n=1 Tax=Rhynchophorus ferrugineus TaxID=354439 RepID=A0A834I648_RHYFE|nr:hypothetical protein GWI33_013908 [Rhynchophorus ferrugineus]
MIGSKMNTGDFIENIQKSRKKLEEMPTIKEELVNVNSMAIGMEQQKAFIKKKNGKFEKKIAPKKKTRYTRNKKRYDAAKTVFNFLDDSDESEGLSSVKNYDRAKTPFNYLDDSDEEEEHPKSSPSWAFLVRVLAAISVIYIIGISFHYIMAYFNDKN